MKKIPAMLLLLFSSIAGVSISSLWAVAAPAEVTFTSSYTGFNNCRPALTPAEVKEAEAHGSDIPQRCKGVGNYYVYEDYSAVSRYKYIKSAGNRFAVALTPKEECAYQTYGDKVEWRLAGGKPFAVIIRVRCYGNQPDRDGNYDVSQNLKAEYIIIRGLKGFPTGEDIDLKKTENANQLARDIADKLYKKP